MAEMACCRVIGRKSLVGRAGVGGDAYVIVFCLFKLTWHISGVEIL